MLLKPASPGTGVIAGGPVRAVLECAGIHDVLSKSLGSSNPINIVRATVAALQGLTRPEEIAARRGLPLEDVAPAALLRARAAGMASAAPAVRRECDVVTQLKITQRKSGIGGTARQRETLKTLGLRRIGATVTREDRPEVRGMVRAVAHLVQVEEV